MAIEHALTIGGPPKDAESSVSALKRPSVFQGDDPVGFTRNLTDSSVALKAVGGLAKPKPSFDNVRADSSTVAGPASSGFARSLFDASAALQDATKAPFKGVADLANRGAVGVRNLVREGAGLQPVQPYQFNYHATQDRLAEIRAANAQPQPASPAAAIARPAAAAAAAPAVKPVFAGEAPEPAGLFQRPAPAPAVAAPAANQPAGTDVLGTFNGRQITRDEANTIAGRLPTSSGPVVAGPNGSFVAALSPPGTLSAAAAPAPAPAQPQQTPLAVPDIRRPSLNTERVQQAEAERRALLGDIDTQILRLGTLNSRGKRQLFSDLMQQRAGLTQQAGGLAGGAAAQDLDAATRAGIATQGEVGQNARTQFTDAGQTDRTVIQELVQNARTDAALNRPQYVTDAEGRQFSVVGSLAKPVVDVEGQPLRAGTPYGSLTPQQIVEAYGQRLRAAQDSMDPAGAMAALRADPLSALYAQAIGGKEIAALEKPEGDRK